MIGIVLMLAMLGFLIFLGVDYVRSTKKTEEVRNYLGIEKNKK